MNEHPLAKELRFMCICFVMLIIVMLFFNEGKVVEVSSTHGSSPIDLQTSIMTQIGENTFAIQNNDPTNGDRYAVKIFKYNPETNTVTLVKEFNTEDPSSFEYQLNKAE